ncbi:MAG TPA: 2-dehydropantoate 2-reductase N-terminal domain-containing protein, partial [Kofleriaceae bacterium]|nr:2-dehydropantoate 2-reductase N-terminal domain-containing protein [Kofleriaceae bacterium]
MKIGVVGAGAIGCYVGGALRTAGAADIVLVGRSRIGDELAAHGLSVQDFAGERRRADGVPFSTDPAVLATCDAVLCCVKSGQTDEVARSLAGVLRADAIVVSLQNGVRNADVLRARLPSARVLAGIVGFNVRSHGEGVFQRTTSGAVMLEPGADALVTALRAAACRCRPRADLVRHQWTKLLVNLNNAVSALEDAFTVRAHVEADDAREHARRRQARTEH